MSSRRKRTARFGAAYYGSEDDALMARLEAESRLSMLAFEALTRKLGIRSDYIADQARVLMRMARWFA